MNLEIGQAARCVVCRKIKKPIGRDAGIAHNSYCTGDHPGESGCRGYREEPRPGDLWPGERRGEPLGHERSDAWLPIEAASRDGTPVFLGWEAFDGFPAGSCVAWWSKFKEAWETYAWWDGHPTEVRQVSPPRPQFFQRLALPAAPEVES